MAPQLDQRLDHLAEVAASDTGVGVLDFGGQLRWSCSGDAVSGWNFGASVNEFSWWPVAQGVSRTTVASGNEGFIVASGA